MTRPEAGTEPAVQVDADRRWEARPALAAALRLALLAVPFAGSSVVIWGAARVLPPGRWWTLVLLLAVGVLVAVGVERAARRLLPIALLLRLSTVFPDRAPSRFALARAAVARSRPDVVLWSGPGSSPVSTADLVVHLVTTLGTHDRRTRGHSERVRVLCDVLATELGLDADSRERLRWAALLHDVGKVEVPASILDKPGRLDAREFDTVKQHPEAGRLMAAPLMPWLGEWGLGIVDHHEKWDGSGYPAGKAREAISLAGRVVGLVDAFETMTAARPYKKAMATRAAREELARCAGSHFDPAMVRAFLAVSLPRVLWAMGPLSFLLQLPFLRPLAAAGSRGSSLAPQAAASLASGAAGAAGAAVLVTGGLVGAGAADAPAPASALVTAQQPPSAAAAESPEPPTSPAATPTSAPAGPAAAPSPAPSAPTTSAGASPVASPDASPVAGAPLPATPPASGGGAAAGEEPGVDVLPPATPATTEPVPAPPSPSPGAPAAPSAPPSTAAPSPAPPAATSPGPDAPPGAPSPAASPAAPPTPAAPSPAASPTGPSPAASPPTPAPGASAGSASPQAPGSPTPGPPTSASPPPASPTPASTAPAPAATRTPAPGHEVFADGPPTPSSTRDASFTLVRREGVLWECQVQGNADGGGSAWRACADTFTIRVLRDGDHVVRVRDAAGRNEGDSWAWTVDTRVSPQATSRVVPLTGPLERAPVGALALLTGLLAAALPLAGTVNRLRARYGR